MTTVEFAGTDRPVAGPLLGKSLHLKASINVDSEPRGVTFAFASRTGGTIQPVDLALVDVNDSERRYIGEVTTPRTPFRVVITGTDQNGYSFQRVDDRLTN